MPNRTYHDRGKSVHGYRVREHPLYGTWVNMLSRCTNPNSPQWNYYGGRGIDVCQRWHHFENFATDMWPKPDDTSLERIKNDLGYAPGNCRWASRTDQSLNRRKFKNNTSGFRGVVSVGNGRYEARFHFEHVRYRLGRFDSREEAATAYEAFVKFFFENRESAVASVQGETVWCTSTSGERGVTPHKDGGFIARVTRGGTRHYLGYFKTIEEARYAKTRFLES